MEIRWMWACVLVVGMLPLTSGQIHSAECGPGTWIAAEQRCDCWQGYAPTGQQGRCEDVDECAMGAEAVCMPYATCINTHGSYLCTCPAGLEENSAGTACVDIDECATGDFQCPDNSDCVNEFGCHTCRCRDGFLTNYIDQTCLNLCAGWVCHDSMIALQDADGIGCECVCDQRWGPGTPNQPRDQEFFWCCPPGQMWDDDSETCRDQCELTRCRETMRPRASDVDTSCGCECDPAYGSEFQEETQSCCPRGTVYNSFWDTCRVVCSDFHCHREAIALPSEDGDECECVCPPGSRYLGDTLGCWDIDECNRDDPAHDCPADAKCRNKDPWWSCECGDGYQFNDDTRQCEDIDECAQKRDPWCIGSRSRCVNDPGGYHCECPLGQQEVAPGICVAVTTSTAEDVCSPLRDPCAQLEMICQAIEGDPTRSVECVCPIGLEKTGSSSPPYCKVQESSVQDAATDAQDGSGTRTLLGVAVSAVLVLGVLVMVQQRMQRVAEARQAANSVRPFTP